MWLIDFGVNVSSQEAAHFEAPFKYATEVIYPARVENAESRTARTWWLHRRSGAELRDAVAQLERFIVTPRVAKHRVFVWLHKSVMPDSRLFAIMRDDDVSMGILHSRAHLVWTLRTGSWHGDGSEGARPTYVAGACFDTFPFPDGLTPDLNQDDFDNGSENMIADSARELMRLRENWLNPPEWVVRDPEVVFGYPDRIIPRSGNESDLKKRTLTALYNENPAWLQNAHRELDKAVATAYGWPADISDDEILSELLELNFSREPT